VEDALPVAEAVSAGVPLGLAFAAGLAATVNPCGFALLPSFVSYYLGGRAPGRGGAGPGEGLLVGLAMTAGVMAVFGAAGALWGLGARAVVHVVPWAAIGVGVALLALGGWLLTGRHLPAPLPGVRIPEGSGYRSVLLFGAAYGVGSLSCTLPVFLLVIGAGLATGSALGTVAVFLAYALGMSTVLTTLCVGTASFRDLVVRRVRPFLRHAGRVSGVLLVLGGAYLVYYWASLLSGTEGWTIRAMLDAQRWAQGLVLRAGERTWLAVGAVLAGAALASALLRRGRPR
jgi:cytochrome c-type biogenesis protein